MNDNYLLLPAAWSYTPCMDLMIIRRLFSHGPTASSQPCLISSVLVHTNIYPAVAVATSSMTSTSDEVEDGAVGPATKIIGSKGTITIPSPSYRPEEFTVHLANTVTKYKFPIPVS